MPRKRFTEEQIIGVLKEAETGVKIPDLCRQHGISDGTFYAWKAKYGGLTVIYDDMSGPFDLPPKK